MGKLFTSSCFWAACFGVVLLAACERDKPKNSQIPADEIPPSLAPDHEDVSYGPHPRHRLDVWCAPSPDPTPVVLAIHGGGFLGGVKGVDNRLLEACLNAGFSVVAPSYRLSSQAIAPASFQDGARALQFIRSMAPSWGLDGSRVVATGRSAGAAIALWLAFHDDLAVPNSEDRVSRYSTRVDGAAVYNAQTSLDPRVIRELFPDTKTHEHPALSKLFGVNVKRLDLMPPEKLALFEEVSALPHVSSDDPPVALFFSGPVDRPVTNIAIGIHHPRFGVALRDTMQKLGLPVELHAGVRLDQAWADDMVRFMRPLLK